MPDYSSKFYSQLIEPSWRLIVLELPLYTENVIFNKKIHFTEDESNKIEDESHIYSRGYESEDEEEKYNLEGLILELMTLCDLSNAACQNLETQTPPRRRGSKYFDPGGSV